MTYLRIALNCCRHGLRQRTVFAGKSPRTSPPLLGARSGFSTNAEANVSTTGSGNLDRTEIIAKLKTSFEEDIFAGKVVPVYKRALLYGSSTAIKDEQGQYSYIQLYHAAKNLSFQLSNLCASGSSSKVAFLSSNSAVYTVIQWACWFSGQIAVPLSNKSPANLLEYYINDSHASVLVTVPEFEELLLPISLKNNCALIVVDHNFIPKEENRSDNASLEAAKEVVLQTDKHMFIEGAQDNGFYSNADAMILYTSGSTGQPKGTLISHRNIQAQVNSLTSAWQMSANDCLLHVLPLHHVHGCVNGMILPLTMGAKIIMHPKFDSAAVWSSLLNVNAPSKDSVNVFMGVPTMYSFLISEYDKVFSKNSRMVEFIRSLCAKKIRMMVSGSAPLPSSVFHKWNDITQHKLLERYGMTEIGMALSNPYIMDKTRQRIPGSVGAPLPGIEVKIVQKDGTSSCYVKGEEGKGIWSKHDVPSYEKNTDVPVVGELFVKGPGVFSQYIGRPDETSKSFVNNWFATGDEAKYENGLFTILGRKSVDIIKTGGYKVSALEIETKLHEFSRINDVCVLGIPDITWGQRIAALVDPTDDDNKLSLDAIQEFCKNNMAEYQIPVEFQFVDEIPRNAMGKVNKKEVLRDFFCQPQKQSLDE